MINRDILVIGGGAAGLAAAASAAVSGAAVTLLEKNERLGKKLFLTGHGRCNVTNSAPLSDYQKKIWRNPKFVQSVLHRFTPEDLEEFLLDNGIRLREEDSGRMFPVTGHSSDIIRAFRKALEKNNVEILLSTPVDKVAAYDGGFAVTAGRDTYDARCVIICTGGLSYPSTGSAGDGYTFARQLGHHLIPTSGALVGLVTDWRDVGRLAGLTLRDAGLRIEKDGKVLTQERGDLLFTHSGLSGPAAFRASCYLGPGTPWPVQAAIDLLPRLTQEQLKEKLQEAARKTPNREVRTALEDLIPKRLAPLVMQQARLGADLHLNQLSREARAQLVDILKGFTVPLDGLRPVSEAIITSGGVDVKELQPRTMESRVTAGLYFAGEVIDVSAMTGGYNLQIAFSTGWAAGQAAAAQVLS